MLLFVLPAMAGLSFEETFTLGVGESVELGDDGLVIGFNGIRSDSRCPSGVWCFWQGNAAAELWIQMQREERENFVLHTFNDYAQTIELGSFTIELVSVDPYPVINVPIDPETYVVTLLVYEGAVVDEAHPWGGIKALYR